MSTKVVSTNITTSLSRSLVGEFYPENTTQTSSKDARQLGATVLDRAEKIFYQATAVRKLVSNAKENPTRFASSVIALGTGLAYIYSGDLMTGGFATLVGAKEIYNQCCTGDTSTLQGLLNDIHADVDMIKTLEEGQQQSFKAIDENLVLIRGDVNALYNKLDQIKGLNTKGLNEIEQSKRQAYEKGLKAKEAYRTALNLFTDAKGLFASSKDIYAKCGDCFLRIQQIAENQDANTPILEKMNDLVSVAKEASRNCETGKNKLDTADEKFSEAMKAFSLASQLKDEAVTMISRVVQNAEDTLKAGLEKAQYTKKCAEKIHATEKELKEIKERSDDVMRLLNEMSSDITKAKNEAQKKLDPSDMIIGVGTGVLLSSMGTFSALAAGATAAYAWHHGTTIANTTKNVYNFFLGAPSQSLKPMPKDKHVRVSMDEKSSGYYGNWVKGRRSYTHGCLDVKLGNETAQFRCDLNQSEYPVAKEDLFTLYNKMFVKLKDETLSPAECEKVLQQLENISVERGHLHPSVKGLLKPSQAAYALVKALRQYCAKLKLASPVQEA